MIRMSFRFLTLSYLILLPVLFAVIAGVSPEKNKAEIVTQQSSNDLSSSLPLSGAELDYLKRTPFFEICIDPDWMPYDALTDDGEYVGINADYHRLFSDKIGKPIKIVKTRNWLQSLQYIKEKKCDLLSSAHVTEERKKYLLFTRPFINYPIVIATRPEQLFVQDFESVLHEKFVIVKGYAPIEMLRRRYPAIRITEVDDARTGLEMVAHGRAFGYIDTVATIGYQTQKNGILNIKISGITGLYYNMSVAVRNDRPELLTIYDKAVASVSDAEKMHILNKWISIKYEQMHDYSLYWKIIAGIAVLFLLLAYRERVITHYNTKLKMLNRELEQLSKFDSLTGIANRHLLNVSITKEAARAQRYRSKLAIIMIDVDYFKSVNDNFGHGTGDYVLKTVANLLNNAIRTNDTAGRWGGEEFLIICPETDLAGAMSLAENIRLRIARFEFDIPRRITVSLGVAEYRDTLTPEKFIKSADDALYEAKNKGRNTVKAALDREENRESA
ncbi:MAG: diguanylate cyclase [Gammaproteobacteria bacterium]